MKKFFSLVALGLLFTNLTYAADEQNSVVNCRLAGGVQIGDTFNGPTTCQNTVMENLIVNGPLNLSNSVIKGNLTVQGPLELASTVIKGEMVAHGPLQSSHGTYELATIYGPLDSMQSVFRDQLILFAEANKLSQSVAQDVVVKKTNELTVVQTIYLTNTIIKGNITFESGKGRVIVDDKSVISGKVSGGKVEKADPSQTVATPVGATTPTH